MTRLTVGVYDLYWSTLGGGEQVDATIAQALAPDHDVTLLGPEPVDVEATRGRLGVDLADCDYRRVTDDEVAGAVSAEFDVFVNGTYLSRAVSRAALSYYYVHFPRAPRSLREHARHYAGVAGVKALSLPPQLPHRLGLIQAGFDRRVERIDFLATYDRFLANSAFTAGWTRRLWGVDADVLHPPVRPTVAPGGKRPLILVLGRFFDPSYGHSKKQLELVETFAGLHRGGRLRGWELAVVGGCDATNREYALAVKRAARGLPISVHVNASGDTVEQLLGEATLYWHAAGYGEDERRHPERFEHFGIAVVEAMAAGAVPLVHGRAGPTEIVRPGVDGMHWDTLDELAEATVELADDEDRCAALATSAVERSGEYAASVFEDRIRSLVAEDRSDRAGVRPPRRPG